MAPDALIVRDLNEEPSNFRWVQTLQELLEENGVPGLSGVDTRKLVRSIRDLGSRRCLLTDADTSLEVGLDIIRRTPVIPSNAAAAESAGTAARRTRSIRWWPSTAA